MFTNLNLPADLLADIGGVLSETDKTLAKEKEILEYFGASSKAALTTEQKVEFNDLMEDSYADFQKRLAGKKNNGPSSEGSWSKKIKKQEKEAEPKKKVNEESIDELLENTGNIHSVLKTAGFKKASEVSGTTHYKHPKDGRTCSTDGKIYEYKGRTLNSSGNSAKDLRYTMIDDRQLGEETEVAKAARLRRLKDAEEGKPVDTGTPDHRPRKPHIKSSVFGGNVYSKEYQDKFNEDVEGDPDLSFLLEKLNPSMGVDKYIDDFVHSDNSTFEGKDKKERIKMALGAFFSASEGK